MIKNGERGKLSQGRRKRRGAAVPLDRKALKYARWGKSTPNHQLK